MANSQHRVVDGDSSWCQDFKNPDLDEADPKMGIFQGSSLMTHHSNTKGNHVHATKELSPGEVALIQKPFAAVTAPSWGTHICAGCFRPEKTVVLTCPSCQHVSWCGEECHDAHIEVHKHECAVFLKLSDMELKNEIWGSHTMMYLVCSLLCQPYNAVAMLPNRPLNLPPQTQAEAFALLTGNLDEISEDDMEEYYNNATLQKQLCPDAAKFTIEDLILLNSRVACNCFRIENQDLVTVGLGVYPGASFFNHSCQPNVVYAHDGANLVFRAVHPIQVDGEACISYIRLVNNRQKRQSHLSSLYYFRCTCPRCEREPNLPQLDHLACPKKGCDGVLHSKSPQELKHDVDTHSHEDTLEDWMEKNTPSFQAVPAGSSGTTTTTTTTTTHTHGHGQGKGKGKGKGKGEGDSLLDNSRNLTMEAKRLLARQVNRVFQLDYYGQDQIADEEDLDTGDEHLLHLGTHAQTSSQDDDDDDNDTGDKDGEDDDDGEKEEGEETESVACPSGDIKWLREVPAIITCRKCQHQEPVADIVARLARIRGLLDVAKCYYQDSNYKDAKMVLSKAGEAMEEAKLNALHPYNYKYLKLGALICTDLDEKMDLINIHRGTVEYLEDTLPHDDFELGMEYISLGDAIQELADSDELMDMSERRLKLYGEARKAFERGHAIYTIAYGHYHAITRGVFTKMSEASHAEQALLVTDPDIMG